MPCVDFLYMKQGIKTITVYGASSSKISSEYIKAARELGGMMAENDIVCINGGGGNGVMGAITNAVLNAGGKAVGVIPQFMVDEGWVHHALSELIITNDMHIRKQTMAQRSDACIALPGGVGTMEELLEIITWKQLGLYDKPVIILNVNGYYDHLLLMLDRAGEENFIHQKHKSIWKVADSPEEALRIALAPQEWHTDPRSFAAL